MKKLLFIFLLALVLSSCSRAFTENKSTYWTNQGWCHPNKTEEEVKDDLYACQQIAYKAPSMFTYLTVENKCLKDRGYVWKRPQTTIFPLFSYLN